MVKVTGTVKEAERTRGREEEKIMLKVSGIVKGAERTRGREEEN